MSPDLIKVPRDRSGSGSEALRLRLNACVAMAANHYLHFSLQFSVAVLQGHTVGGPQLVNQHGQGKMF